ncbi:MAG: copper chaperone CopZ [Clostridiales bacterium]|nr:copper chaperone CopZ [Clostridiales bacterium]
MENSIINVEGMSCQHCVNAITNGVGGLEGVNKVQVSLENKTVSIDYNSDKVTLDKIKAEIEEQGYDVV